MSIARLYINDCKWTHEKCSPWDLGQVNCSSFRMLNWSSLCTDPDRSGVLAFSTVVPELVTSSILTLDTSSKGKGNSARSHGPSS